MPDFCHAACDDRRQWACDATAAAFEYAREHIYIINLRAVDKYEALALDNKPIVMKREAEGAGLHALCQNRGYEMAAQGKFSEYNGELVGGPIQIALPIAAEYKQWLQTRRSLEESSVEGEYRAREGWAERETDRGGEQELVPSVRPAANPFQAVDLGSGCTESGASRMVCQPLSSAVSEHWIQKFVAKNDYHPSEWVFLHKLECTNATPGALKILARAQIAVWAEQDALADYRGRLAHAQRAWSEAKDDSEFFQLKFAGPDRRRVHAVAMLLAYGPNGPGVIDGVGWSFVQKFEHTGIAWPVESQCENRDWKDTSPSTKICAELFPYCDKADVESSVENQCNRLRAYCVAWTTQRRAGRSACNAFHNSKVRADEPSIKAREKHVKQHPSEVRAVCEQICENEARGCATRRCGIEPGKGLTGAQASCFVECSENLKTCVGGCR